MIPCYYAKLCEKQIKKIKHKKNILNKTSSLTFSKLSVVITLQFYQK